MSWYNTRLSLAALGVGGTVLISSCSPSDAVGSTTARSKLPAESVETPTGTVLAAGWNANGQLGHPTEEVSPSFGQVRGLNGADALSEVTAVAAGRRHSLAILADGAVVAWGANDLGQLGDGTTIDRETPVAVAAPDGKPGQLRDAVAVTANNDFSMALLKNGTVVTWGPGDAGQRGIGTKTSPLKPTTVLDFDGSGPLTGVAAISADGRSELALLKDGSVVAWGANKYGMLGDGTTQSRSLPVYVRGLDGEERLTDVTQISMGGQHGLALLREGVVVSWGYNDLGQLGSGDLRSRLTPEPVSGPRGGAVLTGVIAISAAEKHNYAILRDHTVVGWGNNTAGQVGDGTVTLRKTPVQVIGANGDVLRGVRSVFAGEAYGAAVLDDHTVRTWGANGKGQLGTGDRVSRSLAGPVVLSSGQKPGMTLAAAAGERHILLVVNDSR